MNDLPDGFYWLRREGCRDCLVRLYTNPDTGERGLGYGIWDGCAFQPLWDLVEEATLHRVCDDPPGY